MTAKEFAEKINKPYPTVTRWLRNGKIPGATSYTAKGARGAFWMIPPSAVKKFKPPKPGRPVKRPV